MTDHQLALALDVGYKPQTRAVLALLREHPEGITPQDALREVGTMRLAARISELREAGHVITCDRRLGYGIYRLRA